MAVLLDKHCLATLRVRVLPNPQRRLRALDTGEGGIGGAGAAPRAVLGGGKRAAREEAITLPLNAGACTMSWPACWHWMPLAPSPGRSKARPLGQGLS